VLVFAAGLLPLTLRSKVSLNETAGL
jgi:hypothetical protein